MHLKIFGWQIIIEITKNVFLIFVIHVESLAEHKAYKLTMILKLLHDQFAIYGIHQLPSYSIQIYLMRLISDFALPSR